MERENFTRIISYICTYICTYIEHPIRTRNTYKKYLLIGTAQSIRSLCTWRGPDVFAERASLTNTARTGHFLPRGIYPIGDNELAQCSFVTPYRRLLRGTPGTFARPSSLPLLGYRPRQKHSSSSNPSQGRHMRLLPTSYFFSFHPKKNFSFITCTTSPLWSKYCVTSLSSLPSHSQQ